MRGSPVDGGSGVVHQGVPGVLLLEAEGYRLRYRVEAVLPSCIEEEENAAWSRSG